MLITTTLFKLDLTICTTSVHGSKVRIGNQQRQAKRTKDLFDVHLMHATQETIAGAGDHVDDVDRRIE